MKALGTHLRYFHASNAWFYTAHRHAFQSHRYAQTASATSYIKDPHLLDRQLKLMNKKSDFFRIDFFLSNIDLTQIIK
jgi:hypothetical protein